MLYHELRTEGAAYRYAMATEEFRRQVAVVGRLQRDGSGLVSGEGLRPEITFDDGHASHLTEAAPVLAEGGVRAWFFLTAGWMGARAGYLGWEGVRALRAAGHEIGAHGMTHALLTHCDAVGLERELRGARERLEDGLGERVRTMSLPGGRANRRVMEACRAAGYEQVFTSRPGAAVWTEGTATVGRLNLRSDATAEWMERLLDEGTGLLRRVERVDRVKVGAQRVLGDALYRRLWAVVNRADGTEAGGAEGADPEDAA